MSLSCLLHRYCLTVNPLSHDYTSAVNYMHQDVYIQPHKQPIKSAMCREKIMQTMIPLLECGHSLTPALPTEPNVATLTPTGCHCCFERTAPWFLHSGLSTTVMFHNRDSGRWQQAHSKKRLLSVWHQDNQTPIFCVCMDDLLRLFPLREKTSSVNI